MLKPLTGQAINIKQPTGTGLLGNGPSNIGPTNFNPRQVSAAGALGSPIEQALYEIVNAPEGYTLPEIIDTVVEAGATQEEAREFVRRVQPMHEIGEGNKTFESMFDSYWESARNKAENKGSAANGGDYDSEVPTTWMPGDAGNPVAKPKSNALGMTADQRYAFSDMTGGDYQDRGYPDHASGALPGAAAISGNDGGPAEKNYPDLASDGLLGEQNWTPAIGRSSSGSPLLSSDVNRQSYLTKEQAGARMGQIMANEVYRFNDAYKMHSGGQDLPMSIIDAVAKRGTDRETDTPNSQHFRGEAIDWRQVDPATGKPISDEQKQWVLSAAKLAGVQGVGLGGSTAIHTDWAKRNNPSSLAWDYGPEHAGLPVEEVEKAWEQGKMHPGVSDDLLRNFPTPTYRPGSKARDGSSYYGNDTLVGSEGDDWGVNRRQVATEGSDTLNNKITESANRQNMSPKALAASLNIESRLNPKAISGDGKYAGINQFGPEDRARFAGGISAKEYSLLPVETQLAYGEDRTAAWGTKYTGDPQADFVKYQANQLKPAHVKSGKIDLSNPNSYIAKNQAREISKNGKTTVGSIAAAFEGAVPDSFSVDTPVDTPAPVDVSALTPAPQNVQSGIQQNQIPYTMSPPAQSGLLAGRIGVDAPPSPMDSDIGKLRRDAAGAVIRDEMDRDMKRDRKLIEQMPPGGVSIPKQHSWDINNLIDSMVKENPPTPAPDMSTGVGVEPSGAMPKGWSRPGSSGLMSEPYQRAPDAVNQRREEALMQQRMPESTLPSIARALPNPVQQNYADYGRGSEIGRRETSNILRGGLPNALVEREFAKEPAVSNPAPREVVSKDWNYGQDNFGGIPTSAGRSDLGQSYPASTRTPSGRDNTPKANQGSYFNDIPSAVDNTPQFREVTVPNPAYQEWANSGGPTIADPSASMGFNNDFSLTDAESLGLFDVPTPQSPPFQQGTPPPKTITKVVPIGGEVKNKDPNATEDGKKPEEKPKELTFLDKLLGGIFGSGPSQQQGSGLLGAIMNGKQNGTQGAYDINQLGGVGSLFSQTDPGTLGGSFNTGAVGSGMVRVDNAHNAPANSGAYSVHTNPQTGRQSVVSNVGAYGDGSYTVTSERSDGSNVSTTRLGEGTSNPGGQANEKIVCTAMLNQYGFGSYRQKIWLVYSKKFTTPAHQVGYHAMFLPLIKWAYDDGKEWVRKPLEHVVRLRTVACEDIMKKRKRWHVGHLYNTFFCTTCYALGKTIMLFKKLKKENTQWLA